MRNRLGRVARTAGETTVLVSALVTRRWLSRQWRDRIAYHLVVALGYRVPIWDGDVYDDQQTDRDLRITKIELRD